MVDFVLNYLCCKTCEGFDFDFKIRCLPLNFHRIIAYCISWTAQQGQTAFAGFVTAGFFQYNGIQHQHIFPVIVHCDNTFIMTYLSFACRRG